MAPFLYSYTLLTGFLNSWIEKYPNKLGGLVNVLPFRFFYVFEVQCFI